MKDIREFLREDVLLFDGAMGTFYATRNRASDRPCEWANLTAPEEIGTIHRLYLRAGSRAVKTNTFAVNRAFAPPEDCAELLRAGWEIARQAAGDEAYVFADIGPVAESGGASAAKEYCWLADRFLTLGARHFLFETNGTDAGLHEAAAHIKAAAPEAFVLVSFAAQPDGFTREGCLAAELIGAAEADENIDAAGLNCVSSAYHMVQLLPALPRTDKPFSAMPNAGYPTVRGNRTFYDGDSAYFAAQGAALRAGGVRILGGCCGTTPAHIAALARALRLPHAARLAPARAKVEPRPAAQYAPDPFWDALCDAARKPIAVELDPPETAELGKFVAGAQELRDAGADVITIADCPVARARMDASLLACKLRRELGANVIPHMTCRDRNLNAAQALLLGLRAEGVDKVLIVTGDPIPSQERDEVRSVYQFNSRKLIAYVERLGAAGLSEPFRIFAALNVNARSFAVQLELAREKEANGAAGFFTQPVLTEQAAENLRLARETLHGRILGGIMPVVSHRNALFLNSEVAGVTVDERIVRAYEGVDRAQGEALAEEISAAVAARIAPYVDGFYLMTPFGRTALMARIMARIRADGNA